MRITEIYNSVLTEVKHTYGCVMLFFPVTTEFWDKVQSRVNDDELFSEFSDSVAAASIAQVHKARLADTGEVVAVNEELKANPSMANQDPYAAWLVEISPDDWDGVRGGLTLGSEVASKYEAKMDSDGFSGCE